MQPSTRRGTVCCSLRGAVGSQLLQALQKLHPIPTEVGISLLWKAVGWGYTQARCCQCSPLPLLLELCTGMYTCFGC